MNTELVKSCVSRAIDIVENHVNRFQVDQYYVCVTESSIRLLFAKGPHWTSKQFDAVMVEEAKEVGLDAMLEAGINEAFFELTSKSR